VVFLFHEQQELVNMVPLMGRWHRGFQVVAEQVPWLPVAKVNST
jgi:hypothetical protein